MRDCLDVSSAKFTGVEHAFYSITYGAGQPTCTICWPTKLANSKKIVGQFSNKSCWLVDQRHILEAREGHDYIACPRIFTNGRI